MAANYYASGQVESPWGSYDTINSFGGGLGPQADPRSQYTPEQLAYLDSLSAYTADQQAQGYNVDPLRQFKTSAPIRDRREDFADSGSDLAVDNFQQARGQQRYLTQDELQGQMDAAQAFSPDIADRFGTNIYGGENAQTRVSYTDQPFQLYNGGKLVFEGQGRDDALKATQMAQGFSDTGGNKANWELKTKLGPDADYVTVGKDAPAVSGLMGAFINYGIPLLVAATNPLGFAAAAGGLGLGAGTAATVGAAAAGALGGGLSKALQGESLGNILKAGGVSGLTAGALQASGLTDLAKGALGGGGDLGLSDAFQAARGAGGSLIGDGLATSGLGALGNAAGSAAADNLLTVTASKLGSSALPGLAAGLSGVGSLATQLAANPPSQQQLAQEPDEMVVEANKLPQGGSTLAADIGPAIAAALAPPAIRPGDPLAVEDPEIEVTANAPANPLAVAPILAGGAGLAALAGAGGGAPAASAPVAELAGDPITVTANTIRPPVIPTEALAVPAAGLGGLGVSSLNSEGVGAAAEAGLADPAQAAQLQSTGAGAGAAGATLLDKLRAGLSLASLVGGALGGSGGGGGAANPGGTVRPNIDPVFGSSPLTSRYSQNSLSARNPSGIDYNRYAFGPEQRFFENGPSPFAVQQPAAAPALNPLAASLPANEATQFAPLTMAQGGGVDGEGSAPRSEFHVHGAGSGRDDAIDAKLSDNEYVIDAESVALLGDGSGKEGARRLDQFRVNLRKHKGRNLARGQFSVKAKEPEAYMPAGGKR